MTTKSSMKRLSEFAEEVIADTRNFTKSNVIPEPKTKREKEMFAAGQLTIALFLKGFTFGAK